MWRKLELALANWFGSSGRKPLVIRGARQVGKTWLVRSLAKQTNLQLLELNFERNPELKLLFRSNDPQIVIRGLEQYLGHAIHVASSLLFLDEIQAAPDLLSKLRWFAEERPQLAVVAAGSLLDFALKEHDLSMPVGRISYHYLEPMSFEEYLAAVGDDLLQRAVQETGVTPSFALPVHEKLLKRFREYRLIGGMPAVVAEFVATGSLVNVTQVQQDLLATYRDDFHKYRSRISHERLDAVLQAIPLLLSKSFKFSHVNPDIPSASLKRALELLTQARLCSIIRATAANGIPLAAERRRSPFKVISLDVGLATAMLNLPLLRESDVSIPMTNEGGLTEQVVGQLLRTIEPPFRDPHLHYWARQRKGSEAEVDYVIAHHGNIVPIEVKSGRTGTLRSLHSFTYYKKCSFAVRINADPLSLVEVNTKTNTGDKIHYQLLSVPFYLLEQLPRLIDLAA